MRDYFLNQLDDLNKKIIEMGMVAESAINEAVYSIINNDKKKAKTAIDLEKVLDDKEKEIESLCNRLILQQQPVASDLRNISSALKIITDLERIGDQAADIAHLSIQINFHVSEDVKALEEMGNSTSKMVTRSIDAYVKKDEELAKKVINYDDNIDNYFYEAKKKIIDLIQNKSVDSEVLLDYLMIAKYFERIGDHATNIAEWVIYSITGKHKQERL